MGLQELDTTEWLTHHHQTAFVLREDSVWSEVKIIQLCLTLWHPMDCLVPGIVQARILEGVAFPFFGGSAQPRDWTQASCIAGRFFTSWATREAQEYCSG